MLSALIAPITGLLDKVIPDADTNWPRCPSDMLNDEDDLP
jgi:hypothetical protein